MKNALKIVLIAGGAFIGFMILVGIIMTATMSKEDRKVMMIKTAKEKAEKLRDEKAEQERERIEEKALDEDDIRRLKLRALTYSHLCVEEKLLSPSTAEFTVDTQDVNMISDSVFVVTSHVDSQNGYGAMVRTKFRCRLTLPDEDRYRCDDVILME